MASVTKSCSQLQTLIDDFSFYQSTVKGSTTHQIEGTGKSKGGRQPRPQLMR